MFSFDLYSLLLCFVPAMKKKRHQCHQLYVLLGYEMISIKYMLASAGKYFPPSLCYEFICISSINYTVVSASLFVSASLRLGYKIIPIGFQTYFMNISQTDASIVKCIPPRPPCISCISYVVVSFLFIALCWLCFCNYFTKSDKNPKWQQFAFNANDPKSFQTQHQQYKQHCQWQLEMPSKHIVHNIVALGCVNLTISCWVPCANGLGTCL